MAGPHRVILAVLLWLMAITVATIFDAPLAIWIRSSGVEEFFRSYGGVSEVMKAPGTFYFTAVVAVIVALIHPWRWKAGGFLLLATIVSGVNGLIKWLVGRTRPFKFAMYDDGGGPVAMPFALAPLRGGVAGLFVGKNLCFPSGHAALAFATAAALAILWPRSSWRWLAYAFAAIVAVQRVGENAHWLSDVVAAAALGIGGVYLIHWLLNRLLRQQPGAAEDRITQNPISTV